MANKLVPKLGAAAAIDKQAFDDLVDEVACNLRAEISRIDKDLEGLSTGLPRYVKCESWADGRAHITASEIKTFCGYSWKSRGATPVVSSIWNDLSPGAKCGRCCALAKT